MGKGFLGIVFVLVSGCATISGLDDLGVGDAGEEASAIDAANDVATPADASAPETSVDAAPDVADASTDVITLPDTAGVHCGNKTCALSDGGGCCIETTMAVCESDLLLNCLEEEYLALTCDDDTDCAQGKMCCFTFNGQESACQTSCTTNQNHLCIPNLSTYCVCIAQQVSQTETIGTCQ